MVGLGAGLFVALVARQETDHAVWSVGLLCAVCAGVSVFLERRPTRAASLARVDRKLELAGALELGVELEAGLATAPRYAVAVEAALAGRLRRVAILRAAWTVRPSVLAAGLLGCFVLLAAIVEERGEEAGAERFGGFDASRSPIASALLAERDESASSEALEEAAATSESETEAALEAVETVETQPREAAPGSSPDAALESEEAGVPLKDDAESSKLAAGAPSGVTPGPDGGKMDSRSALPPAGAWWPARHDPVVRAWLLSWNRSVEPDGAR